MKYQIPVSVSHPSSLFSPFLLFFLALLEFSSSFVPTKLFFFSPNILQLSQHAFSGVSDPFLCSEFGFLHGLMKLIWICLLLWSTRNSVYPFASTSNVLIKGFYGRNVVRYISYC
ncbi:hypothetical protein GQ457_18G013830 [Hibiscus cannabinus]